VKFAARHDSHRRSTSHEAGWVGELRLDHPGVESAKRLPICWVINIANANGRVVGAGTLRGHSCGYSVSWLFSVRSVY
jgi:hypothetical protein